MSSPSPVSFITNKLVEISLNLFISVVVSHLELEAKKGSRRKQETQFHDKKKGKKREEDALYSQ